MSIKASTESQVVSACLRLLAMRGVMAWRNNAAAVPLANGKGFRRFNSLRGVADILGIIPEIVEPADRSYQQHWSYGRFLAVECKRPGGKLSPDQAAFLAAVNERGGAGVCVSDVNELDDWLTSLGV